MLCNNSATDFFSILAVRGQRLGLTPKGGYLVQKSALALMGTRRMFVELHWIEGILSSLVLLL